MSLLADQGTPVVVDAIPVAATPAVDATQTVNLSHLEGKWMNRVFGFPLPALKNGKPVDSDQWERHIWVDPSTGDLSGYEVLRIKSCGCWSEPTMMSYLAGRVGNTLSWVGEYATVREHYESEECARVEVFANVGLQQPPTDALRVPGNTSAGRAKVEGPTGSVKLTEQLELMAVEPFPPSHPRGTSLKTFRKCGTAEPKPPEGELVVGFEGPSVAALLPLEVHALRVLSGAAEGDGMELETMARC